MKHQIARILVVILLSPLAWAQSDSSFTYQGVLRAGGGPADGSYDFTFTLFDAAVGGLQYGAPVLANGHPVTDGLFEIELDYGANALGVGGRWLEIVVDGTTLSPRTQITSSPYSVQTRGIFVNDQNRVGIGTQTPSSLLHLKKQTPSANFPDRMLILDSHDDPNMFDLQSGSGSGILFKVPYQFDSRNGAAIDAVRTTNVEVDSSTALVFSTAENTNLPVEAMRIHAAGDVRLQNKLVLGDTTTLFASLTIDDIGSALSIDAKSSNSVLPTILANNSGSGPVIWADGVNDASLSGGGLVVIGNQAGLNMVMDRNEIMVRNNGSPSPLYFNHEGGRVYMGEHNISPAYAFGRLNSNGTLRSGSSNISSTSRIGVGQYEIVIDGGILSTDIVIASCTWGGRNAGGERDVFGTNLIITAYDLDNDPDDSSVQFVVYRP